MTEKAYNCSLLIIGFYSLIRVGFGAE